MNKHEFGCWTIEKIQGEPFVTLAGGEPTQMRGLAAPLCMEILRLAQLDAEREIFVAELIGALSLDREAIDRQGLVVGNAILQAVRELVQREQDLKTLAEDRRVALAGMERLLSQREHEAAAWKRTAETCSEAASKHLSRISGLEAEVLSRSGIIREQHEHHLRQMEEKDHSLETLNAVIADQERRLTEKERQLAHETSESAVAREEARELQRLLTEKEHQLALAKETIRQQVELINMWKGRTVNAGRENREKCLELAERTGRIRELEESVRVPRKALETAEAQRDAYAASAEEASEILGEIVPPLALSFGEDLKPCVAPCPGHLGPKAQKAVERAREAWLRVEADAALGRQMTEILRDHCGERGDPEVATECLQRIIRERNQEIERRVISERSFSAAIQDALALVENARMGLLSRGLAVIYEEIVGDLELAREVLSKAGGGAQVATEPPAGMDLAARIGQLEHAIAQLTPAGDLAARLDAFYAEHTKMWTIRWAEAAALAKRMAKIERDLGGLEAAKTDYAKRIAELEVEKSVIRTCTEGILELANRLDTLESR